MYSELLHCGTLHLENVNVLAANNLYEIYLYIHITRNFPEEGLDCGIQP